LPAFFLIPSMLKLRGESLELRIGSMVRVGPKERRKIIPEREGITVLASVIRGCVECTRPQPI